MACRCTARPQTTIASVACRSSTFPSLTTRNPAYTGARNAAARPSSIMTTRNPTKRDLLDTPMERTRAGVRLSRTGRT